MSQYALHHIYIFNIKKFYNQEEGILSRSNIYTFFLRIFFALLSFTWSHFSHCIRSDFKKCQMVVYRNMLNIIFKYLILKSFITQKIGYIFDPTFINYSEDYICTSVICLVAFLSLKQVGLFKKNVKWWFAAVCFT